MPVEKHTLLHDFPEHHHTIRHLKMHDNHFVHLSEQYHDITSELHTLEQDNAPVADEYIESLKMRRVQLKDQLFHLIQSTEAKI
jgi:uncharacterized protein YdcH (DUF465 family)